MHDISAARLDEILDRIAALRVLVVGDLMLDLYIAGGVARISPEAPVPVVHVQEERAALGGAANVAANVVALGGRCDVVGVVGADAAGERLASMIDALGGGAARARLGVAVDRPTTTKTRVMARYQQIVRFDHEVADDVLDEVADALIERIDASAEECDVVVLEDYNKGVLVPRVIAATLAAAERRGIPTVVDPKFRNFFAFRGATIFKPNVLELGAALGGAALHHDDAWLEQARDRLGCAHLLVTLGEDGMALQSQGGPTFRIPTVAREVFDVSGAGDTVTASAALALAAGASLEEAAIFANQAAGIEVGKHGVATVSPDELRAAFDGRRLDAATIA